MSAPRGSGPLVVVANRRAGRIDELSEALAVLRTGVQPVVVVEMSDATLDEALGAVAGRTVVAAGGDGTLRVLVQHLWQRGLLPDTVVGLLPLGTGGLRPVPWAFPAARRLLLALSCPGALDRWTSWPTTAAPSP